jgi:hypothetical protein
MELDLIAYTRKKLMEDQNIRQQIERRAFELYMDRGCVDGGHREDWAKAEEEILAPLILQALGISEVTASGKAPSVIGSKHAAAEISHQTARASSLQIKETRRPKTVRQSPTVRKSTVASAKSTSSGPNKISKRKETTRVEKEVQLPSTEKKQSRPKTRKAIAKSASSFPENSL